MLSAPPRPSRWTGPPGQGPPRSSVSTSIASELLRGPGSPLGSRPDLDVDRVERLDVASPDQGDDGASVEIGRSRSHRHTFLRGPLAFGNGSHLVALVRADATFRAGGGRVGPRDTGVAAGAAGRADSEVWGVPRRCLSRDETARTHHQPESLPRTVLDTRQLLRWWVSSGIHLG